MFITSNHSVHQRSVTILNFLPMTSCVTIHSKCAADKSTVINTIAPRHVSFFTDADPRESLPLEAARAADRIALSPCIEPRRTLSTSTLWQLPSFGIFISTWPSSLTKLKRPHRGYQKGKSRGSRNRERE